MTVLENVVVPDIGGADSVDVIELLVNPGDEISQDTPLITLESDKATMEIPSPVAGVVGELKVKLGDKVAEGDVILTCQVAGDASQAVEKSAAEPEPVATQEPTITKEPEPAPPAPTAPLKSESVPSAATKSSDTDTNQTVLAGPAARRLARRLGVDIADVQGSGRKSRISREDVEEHVKRIVTSGPVASSGSIAVQAKDIDFSKFGEITSQPLNKIKKLTGAGVYYAWHTIPHVTQFDNADITDLEAFRKSEQSKAQDKGYKLTVLAFVCKVVVRALQEYPQFNSSLDAKCENLILKNYFNIGIAVETPNGLVVPVIKGVDKLSIGEIAQEMARLSSKARTTGLAPADMSGGCFTISSLGGIGGSAFTPIVNSPEVAILGLSRSAMQPVFIAGEFVPRLMLPLSLSYDHRVIDGAEAARFTRYISEALADLRRVLL